MRCKTVIFILIILIGCKESTPNETKLIDTGGFEIELPVEWKYKKEKGIDSFVGRIVGKEIDLHFDWSEMGYANHLIENETEFNVSSGLGQAKSQYLSTKQYLIVSQEPSLILVYVLINLGLSSLN